MPTVQEIIATYLEEIIPSCIFPPNNTEITAVHTAIRQELERGGDLRLEVVKEHDKAVLAGKRYPSQIVDLMTTPMNNESLAATLIRAQTFVKLDAILKERKSPKKPQG